MKRLSLGLRPLLLALLASLLALALSELGLRAAAALGGDDFEPAALRAELERAAELPRGDEEQAAAALRPEPELGENRTFLHPYTGYETRNGLREVLWQAEFAAHADSLAELPESARPYTILVLGGSLAELFGDPSNGGVERMAEVLRADERYRARELVFLNHGRPAFKQPQPLLLFAYLLQLGIEPDAVLVLDGFNEVGLGLLNTGYGAHPAMPSYYHWGHLSQTSAAHGPEARAVWIAEERVRELARDALDGGLWRSALAGRVIRWRISTAREELLEADRAYAARLTETEESAQQRGPALPEGREARLALALDGWERASRSMHALCSGRGIAYLHALQPTLADDGSKPRTQAEEGFLVGEELLLHGARAGYPALRERGRALAESGVAFHDASRVFREVEQQVYYDLCHFERPWTTLLGEELGRAFLELLP